MDNQRKVFKEERNRLKTLNSTYGKDEAFIFAVRIFKKADETVGILRARLEFLAYEYRSTPTRTLLEQNLRASVEANKALNNRISAFKKKIKKRDQKIEEQKEKIAELRIKIIELQRLLSYYGSNFYDVQIDPETLVEGVDKAKYDKLKEAHERQIRHNKHMQREVGTVVAFLRELDETGEIIKQFRKFRDKYREIHQL